ncbi:MAG: MFS transporter [Verrucomicrobiota bacterium]
MSTDKSNLQTGHQEAPGDLEAPSAKRGMFILPDGRNVAFTFTIVSSLFLLWGFCNGMIDTMDKHFQRVLHLSLSQSAWVQFAHWMGYFLMSLPAGWLTLKLGYKRGIIGGLLLVSIGGFWFIGATRITEFWAFLLGVCVVASGLTFLETVANPYTTVLGPRRYAATRINLAQSCNGVGWVLGPIAGGLFFYAKDKAGRETGSETLWIPYAGVAVVVALLAVVFVFASVPDIKAADDYHLDDVDTDTPSTAPARAINHRPVHLLLLANVAALVGIFGMTLWLVLSNLGIGPQVISLASSLPHPGVTALTADTALVVVLFWTGVLAVALAGAGLVPVVKRISHHSIWSHEHFSGAVLAQFFYVAAQCCIFGFFINYMTAEPPALPASWSNVLPHWFLETGKDGLLHVSNQGASTLQSLGFVCFLIGRVSGAALLRRFSAHKVVGLYGVLNIFVTFLVFLKLGWLSVGCVFLSHFFMSIMFPTIFALGIFGLGARAKKASAYIVMAIVGGAILPKLMGAVADKYDVSRGYIVPMACFVLIALYGFYWPKLSKAESLHGLAAPGSH